MPTHRLGSSGRATSPMMHPCTNRDCANLVRALATLWDWEGHSFFLARGPGVVCSCYSTDCNHFLSNHASPVLSSPSLRHCLCCSSLDAGSLLRSWPLTIVVESGKICLFNAYPRLQGSWAKWQWEKVFPCTFYVLLFYLFIIRLISRLVAVVPYMFQSGTHFLSSSTYQSEIAGGVEWGLTENS